jgi:hypothetical protein
MPVIFSRASRSWGASVVSLTASPGYTLTPIDRDDNFLTDLLGATSASNYLPAPE